MSEEVFIFGIIGGAISAAFISVVPALSTVLILIVADLIFALWACAKTGEKIESHKMRKSVTKTLAYLTLIILGAMIDTTISEHWHLASFIGGFCSITELVSIVESFSRITGKDYLGKLKDMLQNLLNKNVTPHGH